MQKTLVLQSQRRPLPYQWIQLCLDSVQCWAAHNQFDYQFIGDELFGYIPKEIVQKTKNQIVIATDLARLGVLQEGLQRGYDTVIWCDADFLIFDPAQFSLPETDFALGREVWVQIDKNRKLKAYFRVHNAFLMFRRGNSFLDFYADTAQRLLFLNRGPIPPQFIGPKLLAALHNIIQCPVMESAGMLSPLVIADLLAGRGSALDLFETKSQAPIFGANIGASLAKQAGFTEKNMLDLINLLCSNTSIDD